MKHRHLTHEEFTVAAIEDILARGRMPDWEPLITAIRADPYGAVAEKTRALCERPLYGSPVFRRVLPPRGGRVNTLSPDDGQPTQVGRISFVFDTAAKIGRSGRAGRQPRGRFRHDRLDLHWCRGAFQTE